MKSILIVAAIVTGFTALPAFAASYSYACLSNFQVTLIDLDSNDGITPFIEFRPIDSVTTGRYTRSIYGYAHDSANGSIYTGFVDQIDDLNSLSNTVTLTTNTASASINGENYVNRVLQTNSNSLGAKKGEDNFGYDSGAIDNFHFTLSGNTQLKITADAFNYVELTGEKKAHEYAVSSAYLYINVFRFQDTHQVILDSDDYDSKKDFDMSMSTLITVMFLNENPNNVNGWAYSAISSSGRSNDVIKPSAVPIPAALPLLASAFGVFGIARRRIQ